MILGIEICNFTHMNFKSLIEDLLVISALSASTALSSTAAVPERLALMTDRVCYAPGERVWMRAFLVEAGSGKPLVQSRLVYADLLGEGNDICNQVMLKEQDGIFCGYIDIPPQADPGRMLLRAYTRAVANVPSLECITPVHIGKAPGYNSEEDGVKPDFTPFIRSEKIDGKLNVSIILPEECSTEKISMAISVSDDRFSALNGITAKIRSEVPQGVRLVSSPEESQKIKGRVIAPAGRKDLLQGAEVSILSLEGGVQARTTTDGNGNFEFDSLEIAGSCPLLARAVSSGGESVLEIETDECAPPPCRYLDYNGNVIEDESDYIDKEAIILNEAVVTEQRREEMEVFHKLATKSFDEKALEEINATSIEEIIIQIPGLYVDIDGQICSQQRSSIYDDNHIAIAINGIIFEGDDDILSNMSMSEIARVDYYRPSESIIWGHYGNGVLSISTKSGFSGHESDSRKITAMGFQQYEPFVMAPSGKTVFWNPCIETKGSAAFSITVPARKGLFVHIEGISDSGKTLSVCRQVTE